MRVNRAARAAIIHQRSCARLKARGRACSAWRRYALTLAAAVLFIAAAAQEQCPLQFKGSDKAKIAIYIESLADGTVLADYNSSEPMVPASVMKSVMSATAISAIAHDSYFVTPVKAYGVIDGNILRGDLRVEAVGDPTIESPHFSESRGFASNIAAGLRRLGIDSITGRVLIDESRFVDATAPAGWQREDLSASYGALVRGANYKGNSSDGAALPNPALSMADDIARALTRNGIGIGGVEHQGLIPASTVFMYQSPKVDEMLRSLMVRSDNLMAEAMLRVFAPGSARQNALDYQRELWLSRGIGIDAMKIYDGSGLSRDNRLTARFIADIYRWMAGCPDSEAYTRLFPRAGLDGTMRNMLSGTRLQGLLATKTGSMTGVQCFGGYLLNDASEPTHIVVVMVNGFRCPRPAVKKEIERFLLDTLP